MYNVGKLIIIVCLQTLPGPGRELKTNAQIAKAPIFGLYESDNDVAICSPRRGAIKEFKVPSLHYLHFLSFFCLSIIFTPFIQIQQTRKGLPNDSILNGWKNRESIYYH